MRIVVDANESCCGLADLLSRLWADVHVERLRAGDVAVGDRVGIERKTVDDYVESLVDGRLFRQAARLAASVARPVLILEGDPSVLSERIRPGPLRGAQLALAVGFRIPVLVTEDLPDTASLIRHLAAQEARRESRRRRAFERSTGEGHGQPTERLPRDALNVLLELPGVGRERAFAIAEKIGSLSELSRLGVRDLMKVSGVGPETAARIVETFRGWAR